MASDKARVLLARDRIQGLHIDPVFTSLLALERRLIARDSLILHCAYMVYQGEDILFSAPSETGKTTQANLWEKYRGSRTVNGDRALLGKRKGRWTAQGWPVCGTSEVCHNEEFPIRAVVMLSQAKENQAQQLPPGRSFPLLYSQITVNLDGEMTKLKEKTDYKITSSGTEAQWKENHYILAAKNFAAEGNYSVIFSTQDKAGNVMNNTSVKKRNQNLPIEFAVDKTAPTVVISGVEDGGSYRRAEKNMIVDAKDNLALNEVTISIDGKSKIYKEEELEKTAGIIDVVIASANKLQKIEVTASDAAGNVLGQKQVYGKSQPATLSILVTPNLMVQYYMNKSLLFGSIIMIVSIAGAVVFLMVRKRKNRLIG